MSDQTILITAATRAELELLLRYSGARPLPDVKFPAVSRGTLGHRELLLAVTGLGKVNTAAALAVLLERYQPELLINTGCGGAYVGSGLNVGDIAVASAEFFGDEGVLTPEGWLGVDAIAIPVVERNGQRYFNEFPLSINAAEKAMHLGLALGFTMQRGHFVTLSTCSGTAARGEELASRFGGICENMEGAAVAQVALIYGVDCLEIRGISNMVEARDLSRWDIPLAVERAQRLLLKLLEEL